jgi:shikimate kinase
MSKPILVLVGAPGAGKTTVGQLAAAALGVPFRDTDADIVELAGKSIAEIFIDEGEEHFRALETRAVAAALAEHSGVLALGGGAVLAEANRALLAGHTVAHLSVELADATSRVGLGQSRPLLNLNPRATMRYLLDQRRPLYQEVAAFTVVTDGRAPQEITDEIVVRLRETV